MGDNGPEAASHFKFPHLTKINLSIKPKQLGFCRCQADVPEKKIKNAFIEIIRKIKTLWKIKLAIFNSKLLHTFFFFVTLTRLPCYIENLTLLEADDIALVKKLSLS